MATPSAVTHVGATVTDLDRAIGWYGDVLGLDPIGPPIEVRTDKGHGGAVAADVFGARLGRFRQAHLAGANGVALELFEFREPPTQLRRANFEYWKTGFFHVCFAVSDIETAAARVSAHGGRQRTGRVWRIFPGEPYRTCYCEDPFGNVIELYSHSHERTYANRRVSG
jgi:catechol 2,3-dioxygenase-like lactoylglutathione lyase family enzyme